MSEIICGVDEAGRGPLAGPVVAAAVILPYNHKICGLDDSKKISPKKRELLFDEIVNISSVGIGVVPHEEIDKINILQSTYKAMENAIYQLKVKPEKALVDGFKIPTNYIINEGIVGGDSKVESISAASIVAKVSRDKFMKMVDPIFPEYDFKKNKGYGTKYHIDTIKRYGPCFIHRKSFAPISNFYDKKIIHNNLYESINKRKKNEVEKLNKEIINWFRLKGLIK